MMAMRSIWLLRRATVAIAFVGAVTASNVEGFGLAQVDYGGRHPFERELQTPRSLNEYKPIRIHFITEPLVARKGMDAEQDAKIDKILTTVLPFIEKSWSKHLSVFSAQAPIPISTSVCFGFYDTEIPATFLINGVPDADLVVIVSAQDVLTTDSGLEINMCTEDTLAMAKACSLDQNDRPVLGYINFCITGDKLQNDAQILDTSLIGVHEMGHVLGMHPDLFLYFRDPNTGTELTSRPFEPREITCVDGTVRTTIFPSNNTLVMGQTNSGLVYYDVVTPRVKTVVRNHFNCQSLEGARLENQPSSNSCMGSHWDERLFYSEVLSTIFSAGGEGECAVLSPLSLALMEDSGWYKVSYAGSELSSYGHGLGCDFVHGDCIVDDQVPPYGKGIFCDTPLQLQGGQLAKNDVAIYCDPGHTIFGLCDLFDATQPNPFGIDPFRDDVRYFSDKSLTTVSAQSDFCPMATIEIGVDCTDNSTDPSQKFYTGEVYGSGSRCINAYVDDGNGMDRVVHPACLTLTCNEATRKVTVGGQVCDFDGQVHAFPSSSRHFFECPRLTTVCPHLFCPAGCSGRGVCDYSANPPKCNCFDGGNTAAECSELDSVNAPDQSAASPPPLPIPSPAPTLLLNPGLTPQPTTAPNTQSAASPNPAPTIPTTPSPQSPATPTPTTTYTSTPPSSASPDTTPPVSSAPTLAGTASPSTTTPVTQGPTKVVPDAIPSLLPTLEPSPLATSPPTILEPSSEFPLSPADVAGLEGDDQQDKSAGLAVSVSSGVANLVLGMLVLIWC